MLGLVAYGATLDFHVGNLHNALLALTFAGVGLYVLRARPGHRVGQLFVGLGVADALMYFGRQAGLHSPALPGGAWLAWVSIWLVPLAMAAAGVAVMVFPTGQHLSRRWRAASYAMVGLATLIALASALWPIEDDWRRSDLVFPFDLGGEDAARAIVWPLMLSCYLGFQVMWAAAVVTRLRRAGSDEARQLRWFVFAVAVSLLVLLAGQVAWHTPLPGLLTLPLVPLAAGVAIVRYRLYDIDPVINKTLVGGAMVLLVFVGYVGVVVGVGACSRCRTGCWPSPRRQRWRSCSSPYDGARRRWRIGSSTAGVPRRTRRSRGSPRSWPATTRGCWKASPPRSPAASVPPRSWSGSVTRSACRQSPRGPHDPRGFTLARRAREPAGAGAAGVARRHRAGGSRADQGAG